MHYGVAKRTVPAAIAAFFVLLPAGPAAAAPGPKLKAAYAVDRDADGHVDAVRVKWSKKMRGGADRKPPFAFKVAGYEVTRVARARKTNQLVRVREGKTCDIGGSVKLRWKGQRLDMRRFDPDVPRITCAVTRDADRDSQVDGIQLTYSRKVRNRAQRKGPFLFSVVGYRIQAVKKAKGRFLRIDVAERDTPDSGATPIVGYSRPSSRRKRRFAVRAGHRADAYTGTFQGTRDGVAPRLISATTGDTDRDGLLDSVAARFSERIGSAKAASLAVLGMKVRSATPFGKDLVGLALAENSARGNARPGVWIAAPGVLDPSGNEAVTGAVAPTDGAPPVILAALTTDSSGARGRIDGVTVGFSEPVVHERDTGGSYPFSVEGRTITSVEAASGRGVPIRLAEASTPDTGARPTLTYASGSGRRVTDASGNQAVAAVTSTLDGVAPVLLSGTTADADSDGRIDSVALRFSEGVSHSAETTQSSFTVTGYGVAGAAAASGQNLSLTLEEGGSADSGARPAVGYKRDGVADVRDGSGNALGNATLAAAGDGAAPVLLTARTADVDDDGRLDRVETGWSEPLVHPDDTAAPFPVSTAGFAVAAVRAADGANLAVDIAEPAGHDTGSTPALTYAGGSEPIRDAAGLEPAKQSWAGLTADALPPRLVSATTSDSDSDGSIDALTARFSESVLHARETSQASFTAAGYTIASAEDAAQDGVELKLQEAGGPDSGARPAVTYTPDGLEDVRDASSNFAPVGSLVAATDGARPVLMSAQTKDDNGNDRLDGVATTWSEPLDHANDAAGPFPLSAEGFAVTGIGTAAGTSLEVELAEPGSADTGSAPDLTYDGSGDPIRDVNGLEPGQGANDGLTRDALPPALVSASTADTNFNGKLDAVDLNWSEDVTGATASDPFSATDPDLSDADTGPETLGPNVAFSGPRTRIPLVEELAVDTEERPEVSYDAGAGDLHDVAEGLGDTTEDAPAVATETPDDKAAPIVVGAKTADVKPVGAPNGTLDAVLVTFSEPIAHSVDGLAPYSLNVAGRVETEVEGDSGASDRSLYVTVNEHSSPDGGFTPDVTVVTTGPEPDRVKDKATPANEARAMTFTNTEDEIRPVLLSAQLGESEGGDCTKDAENGIDGQIDCVVTAWSEPVSHQSDADGTYPLASSGWGIDAAGIGNLGPSSSLDILLTPAVASPDRDRSGTTVSYNEALDTPVVDAAGTPNEALNGTTAADPACRDTGIEGNDTRAPGNPQLDTTAPSFQRKCAFDDDWYLVQTNGSGYLELLTRPASGVDVDFALAQSDGSTVTPTTVVEIGAAGQIDRVKYTGLAASTDYWVHVTATDTPAPQEGPYCVVFSDDAGIEAGCGPLVGQLVFTEAGIGNDKFLEFKNDYEVPVEMEGVTAQLLLGAERRACTLVLPTGPGASMIDPGEHVIVQQTASTTAFGCDEVNSLDPAGERLELSANGAIDVVDLSNVVNPSVAAAHSLQFVENDAVIADADANNDVDTKWCRTFAADTKGVEGDGCDEYVINEVLLKPTATSGASDGRAFVEIGGNLPALANSGLLGGWILRGINGQTGAGTADIVLPAGASPRSNGTYVVADGVLGATQVAQSDLVFDGLDLASPAWPDAPGALGPRGLQLLTPDTDASPPCTGFADAFGWDETGQFFTQQQDDQRNCLAVEGEQYTNAAVGASAARDNLSSPSDTTYNVNRDTDQNRGDFCTQVSPNPGELNFRPSC